MSILHVHSACQCCQTRLHAHGASPCSISMCPCCISMLYVHAACCVACLCCMSKLYDMLHVMVTPSVRCSICSSSWGVISHMYQCLR
jgi:hypothetical protein